MRIFTSIRTSLLAAALIGLGACGDSTGNDTGKVSIYLKDAPGEVKAAWVTISEIYLQPGTEDGSNRVVLRDTPITTNLMALQNDVDELVDGAEVPAGTYAQLRFVITGACLQVMSSSNTPEVFASANYADVTRCQQVDGASPAPISGALQLPSFAQTGLKVTLPDGGVAVDGTTGILVDFDVAKSFGKEAGNSGRWVMSPSLKATDYRLAGSIAVTVQTAAGVNLTQDQMSNLKVTLTPAVTGASGTTLTGAGLTSVSATSATATFRYRDAGTYNVAVELTGSTLTLGSNPAITLSNGETKAVTIQITGITTP